MTLVSAVTPTYNRADHIEGAIETVRAQTHDPIEHVIVVDGSTDDTAEVLAAYEDDRDIRVLFNDSNRGIAYSFDRAVRAAEGEFVCILGDDDRWYPRKVEKQLAAFDQLDDSYCGVTTLGVRRNTAGEVVSTITPAAGDCWPDVLVVNRLIPDSSKMLRREAVLSVGGFDTDFPHAVDWDLGIRLSRDYSWAYVPEVLMERRFHDDNVSGDVAFGDPAYDVEARELVLDKYRDDIVGSSIEDRFFAELEKNRGLAAMNEGRRVAAVRHLARAARRDPSVPVLATLGLSVLGPDAYRAAWRAKHRLVD